MLEMYQLQIAKALNMTCSGVLQQWKFGGSWGFKMWYMRYVQWRGKVARCWPIYYCQQTLPWPMCPMCNTMILQPQQYDTYGGKGTATLMASMSMNQAGRHKQYQLLIRGIELASRQPRPIHLFFTIHSRAKPHCNFFSLIKNTNLSWTCIG